MAFAQSGASFTVSRSEFRSVEFKTCYSYRFIEMQYLFRKGACLGATLIWVKYNNGSHSQLTAMTIKHKHKQRLWKCGPGVQFLSDSCHVL